MMGVLRARGAEAVASGRPAGFHVSGAMVAKSPDWRGASRPSTGCQPAAGPMAGEMWLFGLGFGGGEEL